MKKIVFGLFAILALVPGLNAGTGGKVAAGFFGGVLAGGLLSSAANRPRYVEREVIYVDQPRARQVYRAPAEEEVKVYTDRSGAQFIIDESGQMIYLNQPDEDEVVVYE